MLDTIRVEIGESLEFQLEVETAEDLKQRLAEHLQIASAIMLSLGMTSEQVAEALDSLLSGVTSEPD